MEVSQALTKQEIVDLEQLIGEPLPKELEEFYLKNNGSIPTEGAIFYVDEEKDIDVSIKTFLPIKYKRSEGDVLFEDIYRTFILGKKLISPDFIPFALDEGAYPYCYAIAEKSIHLFYMDDLETEDGPMRFIASSLKKFMDGLTTEDKAYG